VVLDKFNALTNALPIWKSATQQVWKPALHQKQNSRRAVSRGGCR